MNKQDLKIMVVDDEKPIVDTLMLYFERIGYTISGYYDSVEAQKVLKKEKFDIVFTDLKMPEVSGMDIVRTVKEEKNDTVVIIFTGYATTDSAIEAVQYGVYDYIRKPFKLEELKVVLDRGLEKLILQRENISLNKKIEKLLSQVTMLADITAILYQVNDFSEVAGMIIDTITEGLDFPKVGILAKNSSSRFEITNSKNIPEEIIENFNFNSNSEINGQTVNTENEIVLTEIFEKGLQVDGNNLWKGDNINEIIFIPIKYLDKIHGYIMICDPDYEHLERKDIVLLFKILATHISPIFQTEKYDALNQKDMIKSYNKLVISMTNAEIELARKHKSSVTFVMYKLQNILYIHDDKKPNEISLIFKNRIADEYKKRYDTLQLYFNTVLVIMPGANPLDIEFNSATIKQDIDNMFKDDDGNNLFSVQYAAHTYIKSDEQAIDILNSLNRNIANQNVDMPENLD
ncbi:MAG: response regulator [Candidatus Marinimicrobia bacterium]|nr:response regulator [Candidatus Neomarinimicrobiota bacterium]